MDTDQASTTEPDVGEAASTAGTTRTAEPRASRGGGDAPSSSGMTFESLAVVALIFGLFAMVVAVFALGLAARAASDAAGSSGGGSSGSGDAPAALDMTLADFSLDPDDALISSDGVITLNNVGAVPHDLMIDAQKSDTIDAGATGEFALDGLEAGEYAMYCDIPGHREAGMEGTIVVG